MIMYELIGPGGTLKPTTLPFVSLKVSIWIQSMPFSLMRRNWPAPWPFMIELYQRTQERQIVPEFELFDLGHVTAMNRLLDKYGAPFGGHVHCDLVMGVPGGMPGTAEALITAVHALVQVIFKRRQTDLFWRVPGRSN